MITSAMTGPVRKEGPAMINTHRLRPYAFANKKCWTIAKKLVSIKGFGLHILPL